MLTNVSGADGSTTLISVLLNKDFDWGLDLSMGYAYTRAKDVSPMTSSTAGSNFNNIALNDINNPGPATSNYVVPHRLTLRAMYAKDFFGDNTTRITMYAVTQEGQPQSYVMGSDDQEGDQRFGRHLLYVPTGAGDPNVIFDPAFDQAAFFDFVTREGLKPGIQARNGQFAKWSTRFDLAIYQDLPTWNSDFKGTAFLKIYNFGNFLNDDWGKQYDAQFFSIAVVDSSLAPGGEYIFEEFNDREFNNLLEFRTLWEARVGIQFDFN